MTKTDDNTKIPIKISIDDIKNEAFEKTRLELYCVYNSNNQNHSNYTIAMIVASIGFLGSVISFFSNLFDYALIFFGAGIFFLIGSIWLYLRATFWSNLAEQTLVLTIKEIAELFNRFNEKILFGKKYRYMIDNMPPYTGIIQSAVFQKLIDLESSHKWGEDIIRKLAFRTSGVVRKGIKKENELKQLEILTVKDL